MGLANVGNGGVEKQYIWKNLCFKLGDNAAGTSELQMITLHCR
jgi:hypothetical protein